MADDDSGEQQDNREKSEQEHEKRRQTYRGRVSFSFFLAGLIGLVLLLAWSVGWDQVFADRNDPETEDAYADGIERPLAARVSGYVVQMLVTDNQRVASGQVLMVIEDDDYRATVARDEAMVAADRSAIAQMQAQRAAAVSTVAQSGNLAGSSASRADFAAEEAARQHRILGSDLGLLARYQMSEASLGVARAQTARSRSQTDVSRAGVALLDAGLAQAQAQLAQDAAVLQTARLDLGYTRIAAPEAGVLGVRQVHVGDLVSAGRDVVSLTPLDDVWVTAFFSERQLDHLRPGQPARLRFDAFTGVTLAGHVQAIGPLTAQQFSDVPPDNITGNYTKVVQRVPVRIAIDRSGDPLSGQVRPGMSALARIDTSGAPLAPVRTAR